MIEYGSLNSNDTVLDIGAGLGFLTRMIAKKCKKVIAVEIQRALVEALEANLAGFQNVTILSGNILKLSVPDFGKVISIPPYGLSSHLLSWLFERNFECSLLIFQKEFADRLTAAIGSKEYGWLSVVNYFYTETELLDKVPSSSFYPPPKVDSVIVRLARRNPPFDVKDEKLFSQLTRSLFTQRNKKVRSAAVTFLRRSKKLSKQSAAEIAHRLPFSEKRVRELAPEDFGVLSNAFNEEESAF